MAEKTLLPCNSSELERAMDVTAAEHLSGIPHYVRSTADAATIPPVLLPWLAWGRRVEVWDSAWTDEQKRAVIAASFESHRRKGTIGSMKSALGALGVSLRLVEWFEDTPQGPPYTFRLQADPGDNVLGADFWRTVLSIVERTKNARSHMRRVDIRKTGSGQTWTAGQLIIELNFRAANSDNVTLVVDGSLQLATQEWVEKNYVSGTYWMGAGDSPGLGLHTNGSTGKPAYVDKTGARDLALDNDVQPLLAFKESASQQIATLSSTSLSGTAGLAPGDTAGVGLHLNHGSGKATFGTAGGDWKDLAWSADVDNLSQQVQGRLQAAVSGTYGMGGGDSAGLGLHTNGSTGKPVYLDKTGARDLALAADVQGVLSGTAGLAPGDTAGVGLHVNHASDRPTFGDDAGRWRDLALATDLDSRLPVSSPTASGSLTVNNGGATMAINPNTSFNGQLRGQITWGTRAWYPGGDGLIFRDNGNSLVDATKPTSVQRFTTQGSHGQKIPFPQQFKSDDVQVAVLSVDSGGNSFHTVDRFVTDRYGFGLSINSWNGTGYGVEQRQTVIDVLAFGEM